MSKEERPEHLACRLKPGEVEFLWYHNAYKPPPKGWEPLMALGGHLWRAALIRRKVKPDVSDVFYERQDD